MKEDTTVTNIKINEPKLEASIFLGFPQYILYTDIN